MTKRSFVPLPRLLIAASVALAAALALPALAVADEAPPDVEAHAEALRDELDDELTVIVEAPFVVVGDEDPRIVAKRAAGTIRWAAGKLEQDYFSKPPEGVIEIYLFAGEESYLRYAKELFDDVPHTPYGYFDAGHRALVMNIATGGGTLVHEMVHPYMEANFPACPAWFNEGLASLYEQSSERDGHIIGLTNWRLAGLQEAIADDAVPPFETLMSTTTSEFYDEDPGTNYAQARYLLYYLQEKGLLHAYYRGFVADAADDPTGVEALREVLGEDDLDAFQEEWEAWVAELSFP